MFTIIARWTIAHGREAAARTALTRLATQVRTQEPDTLLYLVFVPDMNELSLPTASPLEVVFVEGYTNKRAFLAHLNGPVFTQFKAKHQRLFLSTTVTGADGKPVQSPFVLVQNVRRLGGFVRSGADGAGARARANLRRAEGETGGRALEGRAKVRPRAS
jgi:quinol monooxygenase YgiN